MAQNNKERMRENKNRKELTNDEKHNENARASALLHPDFPRINTDNL